MSAIETDYRLGHMVPVLPDSPKQRIAREGMILRVLVGSGVHGTSISGQDDRDEMGVCIEPARAVVGSQKFEHYTFRTQPEGVCSGPGDLDLSVYGLRKYVSLAAAGNPTILLPLFVPEEHVIFCTDIGQELRARRHLFISKRCGERFRGYLISQRKGLMGLRSGGTNNQGRADIREKYGFDTKFAMHMVRLGLQGVEILQTGAFSLPVPEPDLTWLRDLRVGKHSKQDALDRAEALEMQLDALLKSDLPIPDEPDMEAIDAWLETVYRRFWRW